tara:strand:+ start:724 stop:1080 length:357 start_codon:yes stop_codon:yes gene_type:complete
MGWRNWPTWLKGGIITLSIWIVLILVFNISGSIVECNLPTDEFGDEFVGAPCWNNSQEIVIDIITVVALPIMFIGANPNVSTVGPDGVRLFYVGSAVIFVLWGVLVGWIVGKVKSRNI